MKRIMFTVFSMLVMASIVTPAFAKPPSGDSNPSDLGNSTVDSSQIINPH
jgi:hypothetical protein